MTYVECKFHKVVQRHCLGDVSYKGELMQLRLTDKINK